MVRLVIADDEKVIIKGLEKLLDWKSLGIEIIGEYNDGKSALEGIIALRPDIALLDISMPGLSGIDVLRAIREQNIGTSVIFISGFQDFAYVQAALQNGAKDYLLKPVVRADMIHAIEKCISKDLSEEKNEPRPDYSSLLSSSDGYILAAVYPEITGDSPMAKLLRFSLIESLKERVRDTDSSVVFSAEGNLPLMIFPYSDASKAEEYLSSLNDELRKEKGGSLAFVLSPPFYSVAAIKSETDRCFLFSGFSFFSSYLGMPVLSLSAESESASPVSMMNMRDNLFQTIISHDRKGFEELSEELIKIAPLYSSYRKNDAAFLLCNVLRNMSERLRSAMINLPELDVRSVMDKLLKSQDYGEMAEVFIAENNVLYDEVLSRTGEGSQKEFVVALDYIEKHYMEPIGLKTISDVVKMNAYYFSSYFKKNTGVNFKDYLRTVRMNHAMEMIVSSDMSISEIAKAVGIMDTRTFSELFQKTFGEKPSICMHRARG